MRILLVNKFHYVVGGSETYYFSLKKLLESHGHKIIEFSMKHPKNLPSEYEDYFVSNTDYNADHSFAEKVKIAKNFIYSNEAKEKLSKLIEDTHPDIVHLNLFQHQLSLSILDVLKKYNLPVVYTAHELSMICPNYKMYADGMICELCKGGKYYNCVKRKCVKGSRIKSTLSAMEGYYHRFSDCYNVIDYIVTPSEFYRQKYIEFGVEENRIVAIPNFLDKQQPYYNKMEDEPYFLFLGRLSEEKGIDTLIDAFAEIGEKIKIVGTGPLEDYVKSRIEIEKLTNVSFMGFRSGQELTDLVANARAVILPSKWYENGPYSAIEALQLGIPIIGANIGGIPELVRGNGYLFTPGNARELRDAVESLTAMNENNYLEMKEHSRTLFNEIYTAEAHYNKLISVYEVCLNKYEE